MELVKEVFDKIAKEFIFSEEDIKKDIKPEGKLQEKFNEFFKKLYAKGEIKYIKCGGYLKSKDKKAVTPIVFEKLRRHDGLFTKNNERVYIELKPYCEDVLRDAIFQSLLYTLYGDNAIAVIGMGNGEIQKYINDENEYVIKNACNKLGLRIIYKGPDNKVIFEPDKKNKSSEKYIEQEDRKEVKQKIKEILGNIEKIDLTDYKKIKADVEEVFKKIFPEIKFDKNNSKPVGYINFNKNEVAVRYGVVDQYRSGDIGDQSLGDNLLYSLRTGNYSITVVLLPKTSITRGKIYENGEKDPVQDLVNMVWQNTGACWIFKGVWQFKNSDKQIKKLWAPNIEDK